MGDEKDRDQRPWGGPGEPWISPGVEAVLPLSAVGDPHDHDRSMPIVPEHAPHTAHEREQRWHEIATEGLPPESGDYWTWDGASVELCEWNPPDWMTVNEGITHWQPVMKPAPPTREPR